jgi:MFS family permease
MKTLIRTLIVLALIVWLGGEIFFPFVAQAAFSTLAADTHAAGQIVGGLLRTLHQMGLVCGVVLLALLVLAPAWGVFASRLTLAPMAVLVLMLGLTSYSQFGIIPAMERDRAAAGDVTAGGVTDAVIHDNPARMDFDRLHHRSTTVEGAVLLLGIALVGLLSYAESAKKITH